MCVCSEWNVRLANYVFYLTPSSRQDLHRSRTMTRDILSAIRAILYTRDVSMNTNWGSEFLLTNYICFADKILKTLGEGTFGRVVKVKDMEK